MKINPKIHLKLAFLLKHKHTKSNACIVMPFPAANNGVVQFVYKRKVYSAPRAMCYWKHGKPPKKGMFAAHECGNGHLKCINPNHLKWKTPSENTADRLRHGTMSRVLSEKQILRIRRYLAETNLSYAKIGAKFGISNVMVCNIYHGKSWKSVR